MEINICFCCNNNYVQHMAVAITSILMNSSLFDKYNFYVIEKDLIPSNKNKLKSLKEFFGFNLTYINVSDNEFENCVLSENKSLYYKFKIVSLLNDVNKILWLVPYIIVNEDISTIYNSDISDCYVATVHAAEDNLCKDRLSVTENNYSVNSGMMLINAKKCIEAYIENHMFEHIKNPADIVLPDKSALFNPCGYNSIDRINVINNPAIIHYNMQSPSLSWVGKNKLKKDYYYYISYTPWKYFIIIAVFYKVMYNFADVLKRFFNFDNYKQYSIFTQFGHKF